MRDQSSIVFRIVERPVSARDFARNSYQNPTPANIRNFLEINGLDAGTMLRRGRVLVVPAEELCSVEERQIAQQLREQLIEDPETVDSWFWAFKLVDPEPVDAISAGLGAYSLVTARWMENIRKELLELQKLYQNPGDNSFGQRRRETLRRLDALLALGSQDIINERTRERATLRALNLNFGHTLDIRSRRNMALYISNLNRMARIAKMYGWIGIGMDVALAFSEIEMHLRAGNDRDAAARFGQLSGSLAGGAGGGYLGYLGCALLLAPTTAGTSIFWCGILAGSLGAYGGSLLLGSLGRHAVLISSGSSPHPALPCIELMCQ
jgi:hypothetical protein